VLDIQTVHHILKNTAVQNVNKPFVYITDLTSTLNYILIYNCKLIFCKLIYASILALQKHYLLVKDLESVIN
jgi:hypothetical protein